ncbi:hypothetical protein BAX97_12280 [Elizabethkingia meningoseptica]|uniref:hypothetical protein n=1 Tax=Elizabethkingia meningoseptica TaxID=238 RepID=UPI00099984D6|nr:hypothetical protein [Elizabethkingia meningoseptica]OPC32056.1 hypothetical protein BAX97_12280 [Elizabethkingia meningoseptica]
MKLKILHFLLLILGLYGCAPVSKISDLTNTNGQVLAHHVSYDASRRGSIIFTDKQGKIIVISEPPPDVATKLATELGAKADVIGKVNTELYLQTTKSIAELGKRTSAVNILRDALYKLSELKLKNDSLDKQTVALFMKILDVAQSVSQVELQNEIKETAKAETEKIEAKTKEALATGTTPNFDNETAQQLENEAFEFLLDKKYPEAKDKFKAVDDISPAFHSAYEIYRYLKNIEGKGHNHTEILKEIYTKYRWRMPLKYQVEIKKVIYSK